MIGTNTETASPLKTYYSIQGLRAVAALLVVMFHYSKAFVVLAKFHHGSAVWLLTLWHLDIFGAIGVPIFFVISGFVIGMQRIEFGAAGIYTFAARRVARIVPLYWTVTCSFFAFGVLTEWAYGWTNNPFTPQQLWQSLSFLTGANGILPVIGPGWTLEYEMLFYMLFAVTTVSGIAGSKVAGEALLLVVLASFSIARWRFGGTVWGFLGNPIVFEFCAGLLVSRVFRNPLIARFSALYLIAGVSAAALSASALPKTYDQIQILWGLAGFFLVLGLVTEEEKGRVYMRGRLFQILGAASYAIYLLHLPIEAVIGRYVLWQWSWQLRFDPHIALLLLTLVPAVFGIIVHYGFELPANRAIVWALLKRSRAETQVQSSSVG